MPDLCTGYLPPFPELSVDAGALAVDHAGDAAAAASVDAAPMYASSSASLGGGGGVNDLVIPVECRWRGRVRSFDMAGAGEGAATACPAARRGGGKSLSLIPSPEPARTQASASAPTLEECVSEWAAKKAASGVPAHHCVLPFLTGAPKAVRILARSASRRWANFCFPYFEFPLNSTLMFGRIKQNAAGNEFVQFRSIREILLHCGNNCTCT